MTDDIRASAPPDLLQRTVQLWVQAVSLFMAGFHIYTAYAGPFYAVSQRALHIGLAMTLAFLVLTPTGRRERHRLTLLVDCLAALAVLGITLYVVYHRYRILRDLGFADPTDLDRTLGYVMVGLLIEAARRVVGLPFASLIVLVLTYGVLGPWLPGILRHQGFPLDSLIVHSFLNPLGIYGNLTAVSATTIAVYVFFGAILLATGGATAFLRLALAVGGRIRGGAAQVSVISSGIMGMINGSAVANAASVGSMTIPMMKRQGYPAHMAGAIESASSAGGQIMPPIMGAGAFVMAEIVGVPYLQIAAMAIIPAIMYYTVIGATVYFEACKRDIAPLDPKELPRLRDSLRELAIFLVPVGILIALLIQAYTPRYAGFWAIASCVIIFIGATLLLDRHLSLFGRVKEIVVRLYRGCLDGAQTLITIAIVVAAAQIIIAVTGQTGIALKFSQIIFSVAEHSVLVGFLFAALISLLLGLGLPTVPAYIITVAVVGPALTRLGVDTIVVHMFCFFYGCLSGLTPPVAGISFVAAGLARANVWATAFHACRLAVAGYLVPMIFAFHPEVLGLGEPIDVAIAATFGVLGCLLVAAGFTGYWFYNLVAWQRLAVAAGGVMTMVPIPTYIAAGLGMSALALLVSVLYPTRHRPRGRAASAVSGVAPAVVREPTGEGGEARREQG